MRILTNVSKAELNQLVNQPTAKALIKKVKSEGIYIPEGDAVGAAEFVSMRKQQKQVDSLEISDEGLAALKKQNEENENKVNDNNSQEEQIKDQIEKLKKLLDETKAKQAHSEVAKEALKTRENAISQQISVLNMQLLQIQKEKSETNSI